MTEPSFDLHDRAGGMLLPISSLPSPYGIGAMGKAARDFLRFLHSAGQRYWQVLPLGQTGYGDSPYQSFSAFGGNPYFIDLDLLMEEGLLIREDVDGIQWNVVDDFIEYKTIYDNRFTVLRKAYEAAKQRGELMGQAASFARENAFWLEDYALYMALKEEQGGQPWIQWPDKVRLREPEAMEEARSRLADSLAFYRFLQFLFFRQWNALKADAHSLGVGIIGDLPIYVPLDSADVWAQPELFQLDGDRRPLAVAGVPPDYFTADGQLWGNPLYDWDYMKGDGYAWWLRRMQSATELFDVVRLDHFRGLSTYWRVPYGNPTARIGEWIPGPGMDFISALKARFPKINLIAEDLGCLTEDVYRLLGDSGFPGMKVMEFAFTAGQQSPYLPHAYEKECVCYTGTHDNATILGWFEQARPEDAAFAVKYLGLNREEGYHWGMIRGGMASPANLFIAQIQDFLGLGPNGRINVPGTLGGNNWRWRLTPGQLTDALAQRIHDMAWMYGRAVPPER